MVREKEYVLFYIMWSGKISLATGYLMRTVMRLSEQAMQKWWGHRSKEEKMAGAAVKDVVGGDCESLIMWPL